MYNHRDCFLFMKTVLSSIHRGVCSLVTTTRRRKIFDKIFSYEMSKNTASSENSTKLIIEEEVQVRVHRPPTKRNRNALPSPKSAPSLKDDNSPPRSNKKPVSSRQLQRKESNAYHRNRNVEQGGSASGRSGGSKNVARMISNHALHNNSERMHNKGPSDENNGQEQKIGFVKNDNRNRKKKNREVCVIV